MTLSLSGIGVSRGIAIGKVYVLERGQPEIIEHHILPQHVEEEVSRLRDSLNIAANQLQAIRDRIPADTPAEITAFIDTHLLMMQDSALSEVPVKLIREKYYCAEWALKTQRDTLVNIFEEMDDPYLRTRKDDVIHVVNRILRILINQETGEHEVGTSLQGHIVVTDDLTPADTVLLQHQGIAAFITESGGPLSHTAIMARSLRIPAVVGVHHSRRLLRNEEGLIVDGEQGVVLAGATPEIEHYYRTRQEQVVSYFRNLGRLKDKPAVTLDGHHIGLMANIELPEDLDAVTGVSAAGVGLYRTEFLYMNRSSLPDEEEQLETYLQVVNTMQGKPVTIRTLDLGADKQVEGSSTNLPTNPALGLRAIRLCLKDTDLFRPQLRAILRASAYGPVRMMIPMLSNTQEMFQTFSLLKVIKEELRREGYDFNENLPVGGMIEVPAAAISASLFAEHMDFLSIGTNDLIQYTLAIDRIDEEVNYLYDPLHPSVLRLIYHVIKSARLAGIPVSMCGEMAGDIRYTRLLLGLGLREFSMQPASLLEVKNIINQSRINQLYHPSRSILKCLHSDQAKNIVESMNAQVGA